MSDAATRSPYGRYFRIWLVLLGITLFMVVFTSRTVILAGMTAKATIIALWFMHLKEETLDFILYVALSIVFFSLVLFGLIVPDGLAM